VREIERKLVRELEKGLPLVPDPFGAVGKKLGLSAVEVLELLRGLGREGVVRRFGAVVNHFLMGYTANAMVVWTVEEEEIDGAGERVASRPFVSHCYRRSPAEGCPYTLYAMVHGTDKEEILRNVGELEETVGKEADGVFSTVEEYKKTSLTLME
jgi:siroheme decarboxylase